MKIGVLGNRTIKQDTEGTVEELLAFLSDNGYEVVRFATHTEIDGVDVVLVLGGDGAILHAAVIAAQKGIKIIGINYGTLGFLTEYERAERTRVKELLEALESGSCRIVKRSLLQVEIGDKQYYGLNEISIQRAYGKLGDNLPQILRLEIQAKEGVDEIAGDGILICTPTGSTAYSLSAGGAIITPEVPVFMMTPICAFSMRARPIVFADTDEFVVRVKNGKGTVLVDGGAVDTLLEDGVIRVKKAPFTADFPVKESAGFLARVRNKLNG